MKDNHTHIIYGNYQNTEEAFQQLLKEDTSFAKAVTAIRETWGENSKNYGEVLVKGKTLEISDKAAVDDMINYM